VNPRKGNSQPEIRCKQSDIDLTISNYNNVSPHQECRPPIRIGINGLSAVPFTIYLFHSEQQERRFKTITRLYGVLKLPEYRFETRHLSEANSTNQYTPTKPSKLTDHPSSHSKQSSLSKQPNLPSKPPYLIETDHSFAALYQAIEPDHAFFPAIN
jgi:hypothetical protein